MKLRLALAAALMLLLAGCGEETELSTPPPARMTAEAVGHYCQMNLLEHKGPKAQIHIARQVHPLWFSQIRDAVAFLRLPEETAEVAAVYVNDMGKAESWDHPGADNWTDAKQAHFVIESRRKGGMGAPEAVPFASPDAADAYVTENGGRIVRLDHIPDDYILAPVDVSAAEPTHKEGH